MPYATPLAQRLGIAHPILQAPMAGGGSTVDLAVAVSEAGAFGSLAGPYLTPAQIADQAATIRARTARPFGVNLFAPTPAPAAAEPAAAMAALAPFHAELRLDPPGAPAGGGLDFGAQFAAALASPATLLSFTFGVLTAEQVAAVKARGMILAGTATTVAEAVQLERLGVDAVVAQGAEAGGHRGTFAGDFGAAMIGTLALVPQIVDALDVPVVASGGIMDGRGIAAALALGAQAVQMGTAFLTTDEAGVSAGYKQLVLSTPEHMTRVTRAFSGRPARGIVNRAMTTIEGEEGAILPFPLQNTLTRPMRNAATAQDRPEFLSLWAGQALTLARRQPAADLVARLVAETDAVLARLTAGRS